MKIRQWDKTHCLILVTRRRLRTIALARLLCFFTVIYGEGESKLRFEEVRILLANLQKAEGNKCYLPLFGDPPETQNFYSRQSEI